jgi:glyceraldehyde-3-phosphate dehydrogenase/erythrose-4-phosphate dehydrogenase
MIGIIGFGRFGELAAAAAAQEKEPESELSQ